MATVAKSTWIIVLAVVVYALIIATSAIAQDKAPSGLAGKWKLVEAAKGIHLGLIYHINADGTGQTDFPGRHTAKWRWKLTDDKFEIINEQGTILGHTFEWLSKHKFKLSGPYGFIILRRQ